MVGDFDDMGFYPDRNMGKEGCQVLDCENGKKIPLLHIDFIEIDNDGRRAAGGRTETPPGLTRNGLRRGVLRQAGTVEPPLDPGNGWAKYPESFPDISIQRRHLVPKWVFGRYVAIAQFIRYNIGDWLWVFLRWKMTKQKEGIEYVEQIISRLGTSDAGLYRPCNRRGR